MSLTRLSVHPQLFVANRCMQKDVGSYEIISLSPLTVRECIAGESQLCGAIFMADPFSSLIDHKLAELAEVRRYANIDTKRTASAIKAEWEQSLMPFYSIGKYGARYSAFLQGDDVLPSGPILEFSRQVLPYIHGASLAFQTDHSIETRFPQCFAPSPPTSPDLPQDMCRPCWKRNKDCPRYVAQIR